MQALYCKRPEVALGWDFSGYPKSPEIGDFQNLGIYIPGDWGFFWDGDFLGMGIFSWDGISHQKPPLGRDNNHERNKKTENLFLEISKS